MSGVVKQGIRQQQRSLSERLTSMEQGVMRLTIGVHQWFQENGPKISSLEEQVSALVELSGPDEVTRVINERRIERARAQAEVEKKSLEEGVADGYVLPAEKVEEKSLIVGRYFDKEGQVTEPGRAQLVIPGVQPQFKEKLLGASPGIMLDLPDGGKFELLEIYTIDEAKAAEVMAAKQAAAQAAAQAAGEVAKVDEVAEAAPESTTGEEE